MKTYLAIGAVIIALLYSAFFATVEPEKEPGTLVRLDDLNSELFRVGVPLGGKIMTVGEAQFPKARVCYFNNPASAYDAIINRKADAFLFCSHSLDYADIRHEDLTVLPGCLDRVDIAMAFNPQRGALRAEVNRFIADFKNDGTYQSMYKRWFKTRKPVSMPQIDEPVNPTRTIRVGTCSQVAPLCFRAEDGELTGFDMELLRRLALRLNARIDLHDMALPEMFRALESGEIDVALAGLDKDESRSGRVIYSRSYIDSYMVAIVHSELVKDNARKHPPVVR